ncbi:hypothetical protein L083_3737 [Actinoplanes sp. N902-109]|nr:hypothetical protein L083_3737 [Actinoplanes sp. N902-109]
MVRTGLRAAATPPVAEVEAMTKILSTEMSPGEPTHARRSPR